MCHMAGDSGVHVWGQIGQFLQDNKFEIMILFYIKFDKYKLYNNNHIVFTHNKQ